MTEPHHRRRRLAAGLVVSLIVAVALMAVWMSPTDPDADPIANATGALAAAPATPAAPITSEPAAAQPGAADQDNPPRPRLPPASAEPLPPVDTPLAEVIDDLEDRARRGDARAACRLGKALGRCQRTDLMVVASRTDQDLANAIAQVPMAAREQDLHIQNLMTQQEFARKLSSYCTGIGRPQSRQAIRYQVQAAQSGHPDSIVAVGNFPAWGADDLIAEPQLALLLNQYRLPMPIQAVRLGDPGSLARLRLLLPSLDEPALAQIPEAFRSISVLNILHGVVTETLRGNHRPLLLRELTERGYPPVSGQGTPSAADASHPWRDLSAAIHLFDRHFSASPLFERRRSALELQRQTGVIDDQLEAWQDDWTDDCEAEWSSSD